MFDSADIIISRVDFVKSGHAHEVQELREQSSALARAKALRPTHIERESPHWSVRDGTSRDGRAGPRWLARVAPCSMTRA